MKILAHPQRRPLPPPHKERVRQRERKRESDRQRERREKNTLPRPVIEKTASPTNRLYAASAMSSKALADLGHRTANKPEPPRKRPARASVSHLHHVFEGVARVVVRQPHADDAVHLRAALEVGLGHLREGDGGRHAAHAQHVDGEDPYGDENTFELLGDNGRRERARGGGRCPIVKSFDR